MLEVAITSEVSVDEARDLLSLINNKSADVRGLVLRFYQGEGWKALGYDSWKACVEAEFVFSRQYAYALLDAAQVSTTVDSGPLPERHVRELKVVPENRQAEVYQRARETAPDGCLTALHIKQTIEVMGLAPNKWGQRATESNMVDYLEAMDTLTAPQLEVVLRKCLASIPARVLFKAVDEARFMTSGEMAAFNRQDWAAQ